MYFNTFVTRVHNYLSVGKALINTNDSLAAFLPCSRLAASFQYLFVLARGFWQPAVATVQNVRFGTFGMTVPRPKYCMLAMTE